MNVWGLLHKRKAFFLILLLSLSAFTIDIADLRDELSVITSPHSSMDNVTTGIKSDFFFESMPVLKFHSLHQKPTVRISLFSVLPYGLRAPPLCS
ncbi:MAG: hypothetical protein L7F78_04930 [Syntrophales bacterium LBB04]|nr:hypothetical protein [Syntrophales bacterium LBB04]